MLPALTVIVETLSSLSSLGWPGRVAYVVGLSVWTLLCLPTTPIELAAGYSFGVGASAGMSAVGKTLGSLAALLLGRRLLKPLLTRWLHKTSNGPLHRHLLKELQENPIQTMSILRAAPLPTPFKIYGLSLFPVELVPLSTYACIALTFNSLWSLVWSLAGSSASSLQEAMEGNSSVAGVAARLSGLAVLFGLFTMFGRYAKAQLNVPDSDPCDLESPSKLPGGKRGGRQEGRYDFTLAAARATRGSSRSRLAAATAPAPGSRSPTRR